MGKIIYGAILGVLISLATYSLGYMWQLGKNKAVKTKKVCDVCFRDIQMLHNALDAKKELNTQSEEDL